MEGAYESTLLLPGLAHFFKKKQLKLLKRYKQQPLNCAHNNLKSDFFNIFQNLG